MKPTFALNLSNERVGLLHRTGRGWLQVGEVAFDTPDLSEALAYLRRTALGLSPRGVSTKLVIPNSEILYCDVEAPGPDDETRRTQIRAGLAGRTPYAPDDLVFDWRGKGTMVKVAVVARETLTEAEAFAAEHRFGPVSFVALPDPSQFKGEPFFGATEASKTILTEGDQVDPDRDPMTIVTRDLPLADMPLAVEERPAKRAERTEKNSPDPIAGAVEKLRSAVTPESEPAKTHEEPVPVPEQPSVSDSTEVGLKDAISLADMAGTTTPPAVAPTITPDLVGPALGKAASVSSPVIDEAPFAEVLETAPAADAGKVQAIDDLPPAPSKAAQMAFASRRSPDDAPLDMVTDSRDRKDRAFGDLPGAARVDLDAKRPMPPLRTDAQVTAPSIPGSKKRKSAPSTPPPAVAAAAAALASSGASYGKPTKPLTRPGGTFGAKPLPRRGKPRFLGLILTGILLIGLALVAAWSSYSLVRNETADPQTDTALALDSGAATVPSVDDEMLADQQDATVLSQSTGTSDAVVEAAPAAENSPDAAPTAIADQGVPDPDPTSETEAMADGADVSSTQPPVENEALADAQDPAQAQIAVEGEAVADSGGLIDSTPAAGPAPVATETDVADSTAPLPKPAATDVAAVPAATAEPNGASDLTVAGSEENAGPTRPVPAAEENVASAAPTPTEAAPPVAVAVPDVPVEVAMAPDLGIGTAAAGPEPRQTDLPPDEIFLATADPAPSFQDALKLPDPLFAPDPAPAPSPPPPPFGTVYQFDADGLIRPTVEGILSPEGYMLFAGAPPVTPPQRSAAVLAAATAATAPQALQTAPETADPTAAAAAAASLVQPDAPPQIAPADPALAGFRPRPRPDTLGAPAAAESADDARLTDDEASRVAVLRPRPRPSAVSSSAATARVDTAAASLTAQANAAVEAALASAAETGNLMTLAVSRRPVARPRDMSRAVNAAVAAAVRAPEPEVASAPNEALPEDDAEPEPASAAPRIPTKTTVAKQATFADAINLSKINLIGVYGTPSKRYALVRLASGRYKKVSVGDSVDGGRVEAITASEVRYQKSGRLVSLKMPRT